MEDLDRPEERDIRSIYYYRMEAKIQCKLLLDSGFIETLEEVRLLREKHRMVGTGVRYNCQNSQKYKNNWVLPVTLDKYQVTYLFSAGVLELEESADRERLLRETRESFSYRVFVDLYEKGLFVLGRMKFGSDFLVYQGKECPVC